MSQHEDKLYKLLYTLVNPMRETYELLAGQPATRDALLGTFPEVALEVHGVDHLWGLIGFAFKPENQAEKDAIIVD
eukprot:2337092-Pyramimonas_sp.AAC.1